jgi:hypothetical protein
MFEHRSHPLLPAALFMRRLAASGGIATMIVGVSLFAGMWGYHHFEQMRWIDAFANAAMILSGMGPLAPMKSDAGKLFAGCYAIYSGLVLVTTSAILLAPFVHRFLHRFHLEMTDSDRDE